MLDFRKLDAHIAGDEVMDAAEKIGVHYTTLYKILRGQMNPSYLVALALANYCGVTLDTIGGRRRGAEFTLRGKQHPLETLRVDAELTTRALAAALESNIGYLYAVRTLKKTPTAGFVERIAILFNIRTHDLAVALRDFDKRYRHTMT